MPDEPAENNTANTAQSGAINLAAEGDVTVGGDVVGRDKITNVSNITNVYNVASPAQVGAGLEALSDLLERSEEARAAATAFQTDFLAAQQQLDLLGDYKLLHDILHRLQFQCYNSIAQAASRFPGDELELENLANYQITLESLLTEAQQIAAHTTIPKTEIAWVDDLAAAKADLSAALENLDAQLLKKVIWRLNRVLARQPSLINGRLNYAARALRLPALISALSQMSGHLKKLDLDPEKVDQIQIGVDGLGVLDTALTVLVDEHDRWQAIDDELRRIDVSLESDLTDLQMSWSEVKAKAEPLYAGAEEWATGIRKEGAGLDEALAANNPAKIKLAFRKYRRRAGERFFRIDTNLKDMCERLRQVGAPLASVTRLIQ